MSLGTVSIKRPTFIIAILMIVLILGITFYTKMSVRMFPDVEFPYVLVMTTYSGAGAEEIEQQVSRPIEDSLSSIAGIKHITSISQDSVSIVFLEFAMSEDPEAAAQEVRDKMGQTVMGLPDDVETPMIMKMDMNSMPLMVIALKADMSPVDLNDFAKNTVSNDLAQVDGVSQISVVGGTEREIQVNADKDKLKNYQMNLSLIASKIKSNSLNVPAGPVDRGKQDMSYRTIGEFQSVDDINDVVINFVNNDTPVKVKDVANVVDTFEKPSSIGRIIYRQDGKVISETATLMLAFKQSKSNDIKISNSLTKRVAELNKKYAEMPGKPVLASVYDGADPIRKNVGDVNETIIIGIILAVLVVYFFLGNWRSTFITALALPNSLIGAFLFMYLAGFSINVLSLMSLSLAVGLLIDDAIVVRENIFRHYQKGKSPVLAAVDGTKEVTLAVIATTAAVIAVFAPLGFVGGMMGKLFREFGMTIVFAMIISILDALTIAPMLSAYVIPTHEKVLADQQKQGFFRNLWRKFVKVFRACTVDWFEKCFGWLSRKYAGLITRIAKQTKWRWGVIIVSLLIFIGSIVLAKSMLEVSFMPKQQGNSFSINMTAAPGTSLEQTNEYALKVEKIVMSYPEVERMSASVGSSGFFSTGANAASYNVTLVDAKYRKRSSEEVTEALRKELLEAFNDVSGMTFSITQSGGMGGSDNAIELDFQAQDLAVLGEVAEVLKREYKNIPHLVDIDSNFSIAKPEIQVRLDKVKTERLGINSVDAGAEIRAMIDGVTGAYFRQNGNQYNIRVQLPQDQKDIVKNMSETYVFNANGRLISIDKMADLVPAGAPVTIYRKDKMRYINITANLDSEGTVGQAQKDMLEIFHKLKASPEYAEKWKDVNFVLGGDAEAMGDMVQSFILAAVLSILFIYLVLASLYESIITPFVIMTALPLAVVGGLLALIIVQKPLDVFTIIGLIMLLGIVAKNSILLIDYAQQKIRGGMEISDAMIKAGETRLRPILMTSFALIMGMLPTALAMSEVGKMRQGMGLVVIGGIISSTILTLLVVPAIFEYADKFRRFLRRLLGRPEDRMIDHTDEELKKYGL
jgi:hydrophobe/amphiphile efflux-1 (HAE1) family protein